MAMERQALAKNIEFFSHKQHASSSLTPQEPEVRGRKRRKDPIHVTFSRPQHNPSAGSTLRGRCRHRSPSNLTIASRTNSHNTRDVSSSASKRRLIAVTALQPENHRRSRSPSRSRSVGDSNVLSAKRRRQRTQSRSRPHNEKQMASPIAQSYGAAIEFGFLSAQEHKKEVVHGVL